MEFVLAGNVNAGIVVTTRTRRIVHSHAALPLPNRLCRSNDLSEHSRNPCRPSLEKGRCQTQAALEVKRIQSTGPQFSASGLQSAPGHCRK